jgi:hypothetical protein
MRGHWQAELQGLPVAGTRVQSQVCYMPLWKFSLRKSDRAAHYHVADPYARVFSFCTVQKM